MLAKISLAAKKYKVLKYLVLSWCALFAHQSVAKVVIAIVGKTKNDSFYQQAFKGCLHFSNEHPEIECKYDGPKDFQDIRSQSMVINRLVDQKIDGLIVATTDSQHLVTRSLMALKSKNIPVITFDSDLLEKHQQYRLAYVGSNNFDFGVALGEQVKKLTNKANNTLCMQSGHHTTPNLNKRIAGVRYALSDQATAHLSGKNGWREHSRCPLFSLGKREESLKQLMHLLKMENPPIFLAVAGFAQFNPHYVNALAPFKQRIADKDIIIVSADTEEIQLNVLSRGLSSANIGQNPFEMGRLSTKLMHDYILYNKKPAQSHYYTDFHYCTQSNASQCTVNH
jgi:ribose transport system substrate-binding protein